MIFLVNSINN